LRGIIQKIFSELYWHALSSAHWDTMIRVNCSVEYIAEKSSAS